MVIDSKLRHSHRYFDSEMETEVPINDEVSNGTNESLLSLISEMESLGGIPPSKARSDVMCEIPSSYGNSNPDAVPQYYLRLSTDGDYRRS